MKEFVSLKVSSFDHAALATSLTSKANEGWDVVSVVAVGNDIVAYLSRETTKNAASAATASTATQSPAVASPSTTSSEPAGWASANTDDAASTPTQAMTAMTNTGSASTEASSSAAASTTPSVPADWYKDPSGRYEYRYWDGQKWTEHVSRAGTVYKDPPTP